ncbi:MAG: DNA mismatch repair protein MutS [Spirochaetales bacterium]|nr:DNA mismatch repair protein MutS [Spirochaetales bacterium]
MPGTTPMMRQYRRIKSQHRDTILFFRLGDFYEMFEQDAVEASRLLDLTLTQRNGVPMCGLPYHAADSYIARVLKAGRKIAICEQTHVPRAGLATREVTEVITPGTVVDENLLDRSTNNYLVAIGAQGGQVCMAYIDLSTSDFCATRFPHAGSLERFRREMLRLGPREVLVQESLLESDDGLAALLREREGLVINRLPDWSFDLESNRQRLESQLGVAHLKGFGLESDSPEIAAAGVILGYLGDTAKGVLRHIRDLTVYADSSYMGLDESTLRNLEIVQNLNDRTRRYTLLEVLDQTRTSMGSRKLKRWLLHPLKNAEAINERLDRVEFFYKNQILLSRVRSELAGFYDLERLSSRIALEKAHAKDLLAVKGSLAVIEALCTLLEPYPEISPGVARVAGRRDRIRELFRLLDSAILEEPSIQLNEGNLIKPGFDPELDRTREVKENARKLLRGYLDREREQTGIANLKLKYNRIIGHFLEVTKSNLPLVPGHFIRRQTLVGGERYTTDELSGMESDINNASERLIELERQRFLEVRRAAQEELDLLLDAAEVFSEFDVLQSFAFCATLHGYARPRISSRRGIRIEEGRHPVVEANLPAGSFVPNSLELEEEGTSFVLLTGPNMAGKSTFLRQNALIVLMAQIGCFVPAASAQVGIVDSLFCRVGATDNLARGESTFLVEMSETANILRSATAGSLIIMDEVGRGTGTQDGLAIAWAVSEHILGTVRAFTLFATHYHELTALQHEHLENLSMAVLEREGQIVFLKQVRRGPADQSYGIHVAQLAGVPREVVDRAGELLRELRSRGAERAQPALLDNGSRELEEAAAGRAGADTGGASKEDASAAPAAPGGEPRQGLLFAPQEVFAQELLHLDLDRLRPLEALQLLARWQEELRELHGESPGSRPRHGRRSSGSGGRPSGDEAHRDEAPGEGPPGG